MNLPELTPLTADLFSLPENAQRGENICSMVNFAPEYRRLMDTLRITRIVEVGSEAGLNTRVLLDYAKSRGAELITVDPADVQFPFRAEEEPSFSFFRGTSAEFLAEPTIAEVLFLDGDHNYETVTTELETIYSNRAETGIKVVFLHDVSWPCARRDAYYSLDRISKPNPCHAENIVSPYVSGSPGLSSLGYYVTADKEGGPGNGVLTAVEDFLERHDCCMFRRIPVLYGIGILVFLENLTSEEDAVLFPLLDELDSHRELFSAMELNRVENLCCIAGLNDKIREAGEVWRKDQVYIKELSERLENSIAGLNDRIREAGEVWRKDQVYIKELSERLENSSRELRDTVSKRERDLRQLSLSLPTESWRCRDSLFRRLLPGRLRNRRRLKAVRQLLDSGKIAILSLDIFDTLLLRDLTAELERFAGTAKNQSLRFTQFSPEELYHARALAHQMAYQNVYPEDGFREATAEQIFQIMTRILNLPSEAASVLMEEELRYEIDHLRVNPVIWELLKDANDQGIPVIAISDMYWGSKDLSTLLNRLLPDGKMIRKVYSSSDYGVTKASGTLFSHVLREMECAPETVLHLGDDFRSDFLCPFVQHGIRSIWLPRASIYNRYCKFKQKCWKRDLHERGILHGI